MYKVPIDVLKKAKDQIKLTSNMLDASYKGSKLHPDEVDKILKSNEKLIKLLEDNYGV